MYRNLISWSLKSTEVIECCSRSRGERHKIKRTHFPLATLIFLSSLLIVLSPGMTHRREPLTPAQQSHSKSVCSHKAIPVVAFGYLSDPTGFPSPLLSFDSFESEYYSSLNKLASTYKVFLSYKPHTMSADLLAVICVKESSKQESHLNYRQSLKEKFPIFLQAKNAILLQMTCKNKFIL